MTLLDAVVKNLLKNGTMDLKDLFDSPCTNINDWGDLGVFGENVSRVLVSKNGKNATASLAYDDGRLATLIFNNLYSGRETFIDTKEGLFKLDSSVAERDPSRNYVDMVEMFRTGKEPRTHHSILAGVAVLEALEESVNTGDWVNVPGID